MIRKTAPYCTMRENDLSISESRIDCNDHFSLRVGLRDMTIWYRNDFQYYL